jgi:hypothetical protein
MGWGLTTTHWAEDHSLASGWLVVCVGYGGIGAKVLLRIWSIWRLCLFRVLLWDAKGKGGRRI